MSAKERNDDAAECRSRRHVRLAALAVAAGLLLEAGAAVAVDYYLRGGLGVDWPGNTAFTDIDCASAAPAALYGCGIGDDGAPYRSGGRFRDSARGRAGARLRGGTGALRTAG